MAKILEGKIKVTNDTNHPVEIWDKLPTPDVQITQTTGFLTETLAKEYVQGLQSLNNKSEKYLEGVQKALDLLTV